MQVSFTTTVVAVVAIAVMGGLIGVAIADHIPNPEKPPRPLAEIASPLSRQLQPTVAATITPAAQEPSTTAAVPPQPTATPAANAAIEIVNLPDTIHSGQPFTIRWRITGPAGTHGANTTLTTNYDVTTTNNGSRAATKSRNKQSFGSFTIPADFDTNLSLGGNPGPIEVTITADIAGQNLSITRTINLIE